MTLSNTYFEQVLAKVDALPPVSEVLRKILELTSGEDTSRAELIRCVSLDPAISAKVLQSINSAYFGMSQKVSSIEVAVGLLGDRSIRDIAIMCSASSALRKSIVGYGVLADQFWLHSITTAFAARLIAGKCAPSERETAFAAGLLHDVGKLVMDLLLRETQLTMTWDDSVDILPDVHLMENEAFGFDHATVGYFVCRNWNFPEKLSVAIAFHHQPDLESEYQELIRIVNFADVLSHLFALGLLDPKLVVLLEDEGRIPFALSAGEIEKIFSKLKAEVEGSNAFLGI